MTRPRIARCRSRLVAGKTFMDKSFAAVTGNVVTDWPRVIERLDTMSNEEHDLVTNLASMWPTCAVGIQCAIIPRKPTAFANGPGEPKDHILRRHGGNFAMHIKRRDKPAALTCWQVIEARATELVAQELAKLNAP